MVLAASSNYSYFRNAQVTCDVLQNNFISGNGLGSHEISYDRYTKKSEFSEYGLDELNKQDANSLFLRILSEMGIFGIIIFFVYIFKYFLRRSRDPTNYLWIINNSIFVLIIIRLIRQGHYFSEGFFFFFWLYYFTKKLSLGKMSDSVENR